MLVHDIRGKAVPIASDTTVLFYNNLFIQYPKFKSLFKGGMAQSGAMLMQIIGLMIWMVLSPTRSNLGFSMLLTAHRMLKLVLR